MKTAKEYGEEKGLTEETVIKMIERGELMGKFDSKTGIWYYQGEIENQGVSGYSSGKSVTAVNGEVPVSVGNWILTLILLSIPVVNVIAFIVYLASDKTPASKKNYMIALLVFLLIAILFGFLFWGSIGSLLYMML